MKRTYKNLFSLALGTLMSLSLAFTATAQHRGGGGGGGGARSSGGGGGGGGGVRSSGGSFSRPSSPSPSSYSRPSFGGGTRSAVAAPQRTYGSGSATRSNVTTAPQRTYGNGTRSNIAVAPGGNRVGTAGTATRSYGTRGYASVDRRAYNGGRGTYYRNGNYGYGNRVYSNYRYGGRGGYFGNHYWYPYRNYYNSYYYPRLGFSIGFLPYGYYPFYWGDYQYFYSDGLYYRQYNDQYTVVEPPIGAEIKQLPSDAQSIMINGEQYYESNGVYYQPITKDDGTSTYVIAGKDGELNTDQGNGGYDQAPQIGDVVGQLPQDSRKIKINGEKLYISPDGYYYQETTDNNGNKAYKIVGTPSDDQQGDQQDNQDQQ